MDNAQLPSPHPGRRLKMEIEKRGLNQKEFADLLGIPQSQVSDIINGKRNFTPSIALSLETHWGTPAEIWVKMQWQYDLYAERTKKAAAMKAADLSVNDEELIFRYVAIKYFIKQKAFNNSPQSIRDGIKKIFGIDQIQLLPELFQQFKSSVAFYRKSESLQEDIKQRFCWEALVQYKARQKRAQTFQKDWKETLIPALKQIFWHHYSKPNYNVVEATEKKLLEFGIKFVIQEKPPKGPFDGFAFLSNGTPAIAMTLRHKRLDNFAFTLLHELGHVYYDLEELDQIKHFDDTAKGFGREGLNEREERANKFAGDLLIPPSVWSDFRRFVKKTDPGILYFANQMEIHPGILRGRLCRELPSYYKRQTQINKMNKLVV